MIGRFLWQLGLRRHAEAHYSLCIILAIRYTKGRMGVDDSGSFTGVTISKEWNCQDEVVLAYLFVY